MYEYEYQANASDARCCIGGGSGGGTKRDGPRGPCGGGGKPPLAPNAGTPEELCRRSGIETPGGSSGSSFSRHIVSSARCSLVKPCARRYEQVEEHWRKRHLFIERTSCSAVRATSRQKWTICLLSLRSTLSMSYTARVQRGIQTARLLQARESFQHTFGHCAHEVGGDVGVGHGVGEQMAQELLWGVRLCCSRLAVVAVTVVAAGGDAESGAAVARLTPRVRRLRRRCRCRSG